MLNRISPSTVQQEWPVLGDKCLARMRILSLMAIVYVFHLHFCYTHIILDLSKRICIQVTSITIGIATGLVGQGNHSQSNCSLATRPTVLLFFVVSLFITRFWSQQEVYISPLYNNVEFLQFFEVHISAHSVLSNLKLNLE